MKYIYIVLISILLFSSCEKTLKVKMEDKGRKVVVNSIFYADSSLSVILMQSEHIQSSSENYQTVDDATIQLLENGIEVESVNNFDNGLYHFNYTPKEDKIYEILINSTKLGQASASTYIPSKADITNIEYNTDIKSDEYETYISGIDFKVKLNDKENIKNYYLLQVFVKSTYTYYDEVEEKDVSQTNIYPIDLESNDPSLTKMTNSTFGFLFNDELFDGTSHTLNLSTQEGRWYGDESETKFYFRLYNISADLYKFYLSYNQYYETRDNPFAEPVKVYNNVENGYGIFGGSNANIDSVKVDLSLTR